MNKTAKPEQEMMWATHRIDDCSGRPYWHVYAAGDKDGDDMNEDKSLELCPNCFPPGSRVVVLEPDMDEPESKAFYEAMGNGKDYYGTLSENEG